jgi:hypothetical protein
LSTCPEKFVQQLGGAGNIRVVQWEFDPMTLGSIHKELLMPFGLLAGLRAVSFSLDELETNARVCHRLG